MGQSGVKIYSAVQYMLLIQILIYILLNIKSSEMAIDAN